MGFPKKRCLLYMYLYDTQIGKFFNTSHAQVFDFFFAEYLILGHMIKPMRKYRVPSHMREIKNDEIK